MSELVQAFPLRDVPAELKEALVRDAKELGKNVNDVLVGILSRHFGVAFEGTGRRSDSADEKVLVITPRMPRDLRAAIKRAAIEESGQDVILRTLCEHYGIRFVKKIRPRRRRRSLPAAA